jgi:RNA polymerase sigma-70 factor (ECF subfamily)
MDLLARFAQGDLEAFETLFRQFQGEVYGWIMRMVRDPFAAEDLTLETFWRIYRARCRFDPRRSFGAWARRIASNVAIDHLKSRRRAPPLPADTPAPAAPDPAVQGETARAIHQALADLPAPLRVTAILALVEERPYQEIAAALDLSVGGVKTRVFRATRLLRESLRRRGFEP